MTRSSFFESQTLDQVTILDSTQEKVSILEIISS
jgi:hypothetical protein